MSIHQFSPVQCLFRSSLTRSLLFNVVSYALKCLALTSQFRCVCVVNDVLGVTLCVIEDHMNAWTFRVVDTRVEALSIRVAGVERRGLTKLIRAQRILADENTSNKHHAIRCNDVLSRCLIVLWLLVNLCLRLARRCWLQGCRWV